jgi:hypothetical protein
MLENADQEIAFTGDPNLSQVEAAAIQQLDSGNLSGATCIPGMKLA